MDAYSSFWDSRRVVVCGCTDELGALIAELLHTQKALVSGLVSKSPVNETRFILNRLYESVAVIRAASSDAASLAGHFAANETEAVFIASSKDAKATHAALAAARVAVPNAAIVVAVPTPASRIVAMVNTFRKENFNPIGLAVVPHEAAGELAAAFLVSLAERVIQRDTAVLSGKVEMSTGKKLAA